MAEFFAHVRVDYCKLTGAKVKTFNIKQDRRITLEWNGENKKLFLIVEKAYEDKVRLPLVPPLQMITKNITQGELGIVVTSCKLTYNSDPTQLQIMFSHGVPEKLQKVRDAINVCMARILGRAVKKLPQVVEPEEDMNERLLTKKRKADHLDGAPSGSELSTGSRDSTLDAVTSKLSGAQDSEELPELSDEQQRIMDLVKDGHSVFFTGCAGTGKSLILKHILKAMPSASTYVTASTGIAACHLGGTTLHAFAGIGRATDLTAALVGARSRDARQRWQKATTLIADEVSMVDAKLFDLVEEVARHVRNSDLPFGGIQLILCGDFHQLPPVFKQNEGGVRKFCFESQAWAECNLYCMQLKKVYRQADDEFVNMLAKIRSGQGAAFVKDLRERCSAPIDIDGIVATRLFTHREDVDLVNATELKALPGEAKQFVAKDTGNEEALRMSCPARRVVDLKVGAQVMLIRNVSQRRGLVNGSRGVIERWVGKSNPLPVVRFVNGVVTTIGQEKWNIMSGSKTLASRLQIPLELGWGITVHKCQGMTLDAVQINLEKAFEPGMAYVALSRVKSLEGLQIVGNIHSRALEAHPKVLAFYRDLERLQC